jgi:hypothetical protein
MGLTTCRWVTVPTTGFSSPTLSKITARTGSVSTPCRRS